MTAFRSFRRSCLRGAQALLDVSGLARLYVRVRNVRGAIILMYHSVAAAPDDQWIDPDNHLGPDRFERQMRFLARRRRVVPLAEVVRALQEGRELPAGSVAITFDDGYRDNLSVAAPILHRLGLPATLFLSTHLVRDGHNQWIDDLHSIFRARQSDGLVLPVGSRRSHDLSRPNEESEAYSECSKLLLEASIENRRAWIEDLARQLRPSAQPPRLTLTWDEVRDLAARFPGFEIGGHGRSHLDVRIHGGPNAENEIAGCFQDLLRELGRPPSLFAFPYDRWTPEAQIAVRRAGFRAATGSGTEYLITPRSDLFALPRIEPYMGRFRFSFVTSGAYPGLSRAILGRT